MTEENSRGFDRSRYFRVSSSGSRFKSPVVVEGWSHKSLWGREDDRFFLTLWHDETPFDAEPEHWVSVADQHPLVSAGCVALALMTRVAVDPFTACAGLQMLAPDLVEDPRPAIGDVAAAALDELLRETKEPDEFTIGAWQTYRWVMGEVPDAPVSRHRYEMPVPGYQQIVAEWNVLSGLMNQLTGHSARGSFEGVDAALTAILRAPLKLS